MIPLLSLALLSCITAQNTAEKTLIKSFNLQGNDVVDLDLGSNVEIQQWNSPTLRIEMVVSLDNGSETMLKSLIKAGRYNPSADETTAGFKVFMPGLERQLMVRGQPLRDNISYIVSVPSDVLIAEDMAIADKNK
jgi:hypothetical protein